jgi:phosphoribosylglycinamide formyltransferase 1
MKACEQRELSADIELVISNNPDSDALKIAQQKNISTAYLSSRTHPDQDALDIAMKDLLESHSIDLVLLAGFMKKIGPKTLSAYKGKIINVHPSLLPKFGGQGMYGLNVHEAVIAAGEKETGVTIHMVDGEYDQGKILAQEKVEVMTDDTAESLAARVLKIEHQLYSETIQKIIDKSILLP